jgi:hypothetical protein
MNNLVNVEDIRIRSVKINDQMFYSVYDFIRYAGDYRNNERNVFKRLIRNYPEVVSKCNNFQFEGQGQKLTPVTNRQGILTILGLLPGLIGAKYRAEVAELVRLWLDEPEKLAILAKNRSDTRIEGIETRKKLIDALDQSDHQVNRAIVTDTVYGAVTKRKAKQIRSDLGLTKKSQPTRDYLDDALLAQIMDAEVYLSEKISQAKTPDEIYQIAHSSGLQARNKTGIV